MLWVFVAVRRLCLAVVRRLLIVGSSLAQEHQALSAPASVVAAHGLSDWDSSALEHRLSSGGTRT